MKKASDFLNKYFAPIALALICLTAYGLLAPFTGFYGDEWQIVYEYIVNNSAGLARYLYDDGHPLATWSYVLSFNLLGIQPLAWQLYSLVLRVLSVLGFWIILRRVWPQKPREIWMAAVLFALYPQFHLQAQAVSYYEVWLSYIFLWLSFYFSIRSLQEPQRFWVYTLAAVVFKIGHPLSSEYTWGTELMRPFLLWFALAPALREQVKASVWRVVAALWPHVLLSLALFVWRVVLYQSPTGFRADPRLIEWLVKDPWQTLRGVLLYIVPDTVLILFTSWQKVFQPETFNFGSLFNILSLLIAVVGGGLTWLVLRREHQNMDEKLPGWTIGALLTGLASLIFGLLPLYVGGYFPSTGTEPWSGRFILGSLPGIALLVVLMITFFIRDADRQVLFFSLLTGLMLAWQLQAGNEFRRMWNNQADFFRQLVWRASALERNTAILVDGNILPLMRGVGFALNAVYEQAPSDKGQLAYWYFFMDNKIFTDTSSLPGGVEIRDGRYSTYFEGNSRDMVAVSFRTDGSQCLWLVNADQARYAPRSSLFGQISGINAFDRILPSSRGDTLEKLFGRQEPPAWCYYFEKADLARQLGDWELAKSLWEQAESRNIKPLHGLEYLPFIEAYARLNDWEKAVVLNRQSNRASPEMESALCPFWQRMDQELPRSNGKDYFLPEAVKLLGCKN
jgi:tetratricopeptide (TPR) repeat protein